MDRPAWAMAAKLIVRTAGPARFAHRACLGLPKRLRHGPRRRFDFDRSVPPELDHVARSLDLISRAFAGQPGGLSRNDVLNNITHFWLTITAVSAARLYWEYKGGYFNAKGVSIPVAVSVFPDEIYAAPRSWAERAYPNLIRFNMLDKGGHFAAWEQPELFCEEIRAAFRPLR
jgi:pimeloyl-ACP methyl ester carboxylesterase